MFRRDCLKTENSEGVGKGVGAQVAKIPSSLGEGVWIFLEQYHIQALWYQSVVVIKYLTSHFVSDGQRLCK